MKANAYVTKDIDHDAALNLVMAGIRLADAWREKNPGRRYGLNTEVKDGVFCIELVGWTNG